MTRGVVPTGSRGPSLMLGSMGNTSRAAGGGEEGLIVLLKLLKLPAPLKEKEGPACACA